MKPAPFGAGYRPVLADGRFIAFCVGYMLAGMAYSIMMVLLPVYAKENFGVAESQYGLIMMTNGGLVVLSQMFVTHLSGRYRQFRVLAAGSLVWALGVGSVALGRGFFAFLASMVVVTIGEMMVMPSSKTLSANLASSSMRGKYMGVYDATRAISFGIGPVLGGFLNDTLSPVAMWYAGGLLGAAAAGLFIRLETRRPS
jgi:MFS family permease